MSESADAKKKLLARALLLAISSRGKSSLITQWSFLVGPMRGQSGEFTARRGRMDSGRHTTLNPSTLRKLQVSLRLAMSLAAVWKSLILLRHTTVRLLGGESWIYWSRSWAD